MSLLFQRGSVLTNGDFEDELFVPVWEGPYAEARERMIWLEEAHIPTDLGDALAVGQARVEVPPEYAEEARAIMRSGPRPTASVPLIDPSAPTMAIWKVAIVAIVLLAIVLTLVL